MPGNDDNGVPKMYVYIEWSEPYDELPPEKARSLGIATKGVSTDDSDVKDSNSGPPPPILDG
jgi:hypothetical protein